MTALAKLMKLIELSESGDAGASLELAEVFWHGLQAMRENPLLANLYLNRYYVLKCLHIPGFDQPVQEAARQALSDGDRSSTCVVPHAFCSGCPNHDDPSVVIFTGPYKITTAEDLIGYGVRCAENTITHCLPACTSCGAALECIAADFYAPGLHQEHYFVIRSFFNEEGTAAQYALFWQNAAEALHLSGIDTPVPDDSERCFLILERAARLLSFGLDDLAAATIGCAFRQFNGDPALVHATGLLAGSKYGGLAEQIARSHTEAFPQDPLGHLHLAEVLMRERLIEHGQLSNAVLDEALKSVRTALQLRPDWREALLVECMLLSLAKPMDKTVVSAYKNLLLKHSAFAPGHYDFALYSRQLAPEISQRHLARALRFLPPEARPELSESTA